MRVEISSISSQNFIRAIMREVYRSRRLKFVRSCHWMTRTNLAEISGYNIQYINNFEQWARGKTMKAQYRLPKLLEALDLLEAVKK